MTTKKMMMPEPSMIADGKRSRAPSLAMIDSNNSTNGKEELMEGGNHSISPSTTRSSSNTSSSAGGYSQWTAPWAGQPIDSELLHALSSIAPTVLRPNLISLRPSPTTAFTNSTGGANSPVLDASTSPSRAGNSSNDDDDDGSSSGGGGGPGPKVKFVNATVEILQNQIRKEEAPKKKRTRTTPEQLRILQKAFSTDPMPNSSNRLVLAKRLGMNARAVQVWFQNRRAKEKLEAKRAEGGGNTNCASMANSTGIGGILQGPPGNVSKTARMPYYGVGSRSASIDSATDAFYRHHHQIHGHRQHQHHRSNLAHYQQQSSMFHPNQLILPGSPTDNNRHDDEADDDGNGGPCAGLTDYFLGAGGGTGPGGTAADTVGGFLYNSYALEPMVSMGGELFGTPGGHDEGTDGPENSGLGGPNGYLRFQSYPGALDGNSLGLIFDMEQTGGNSPMEANTGSSSSSPSGSSASNVSAPSQALASSSLYQRCNSIDVLGRMMLMGPDVGGDTTSGLLDVDLSTSASGTSGTASPAEVTLNNSKIFCNPSSGEAFLGTGSILGASIPMPKGRSLSVPDLSLGRGTVNTENASVNISSASMTEDDLITAAVGILRPTAELLSIREEEHTNSRHRTETSGSSRSADDHGQNTSNSHSGGGGKESPTSPMIPSATSLLSPFAAMPELLSLEADTMMNTLPSWSTADL